MLLREICRRYFFVIGYIFHRKKDREREGEGERERERERERVVEVFCHDAFVIAILKSHFDGNTFNLKIVLLLF